MGAQSAAIEAALESKVATAAKALILEIDANLRRSPSMGGTPVKTGHARASWVPSIGTPATATPSGASDSAHAAGVAQVLSYKLDNGVLFLSNFADYIKQLNLGSSKQAPAGFIEACIDHAVATIHQTFGVHFDIKTSGAGTFSDEAGGQAASNLASAYSPFGGDE